MKPNECKKIGGHCFKPRGIFLQDVSCIHCHTQPDSIEREIIGNTMDLIIKDANEKKKEVKP